jgi:hypothetical protein
MAESRFWFEWAERRSPGIVSSAEQCTGASDAEWHCMVDLCALMVVARWRVLGVAA